MPISLFGMKNVTKEITAETPFGDVKFAYRPSILTPEFQSKIQGLAQDGDPGPDKFVGLFCELVARWDVTANEGDKEPLAVEPKIVSTISWSVINAIFSAASQDMVPNAGKPQA